ncbi:MAG: DUF305 domain-containing protein [Bacteroidetes bacterium]|nr:DUF305 domain-containing protein [Bacteroidota bacterium]
MNIDRVFTIVLLLCSTVFVSACSSTGNMASESTANVSTTKSDAALEAEFWAKIQAAKMTFVQADVDFMTGMIGHHAQALIMSEMAPKNGAGSEVQILTSRIINAQKDEIATMQNWLKERGREAPQVHIDGTTLMVHGGGDHAMQMPGMLTQEQLEELNAAKGVDYDRLFLTYMIQHHQGAVSMVKELFSHDGAGQEETSFKLANDIQVDQITEIARMELMLKALSETN